MFVWQVKVGLDTSKIAAPNPVRSGISFYYQTDLRLHLYLRLGACADISRSLLTTTIGMIHYGMESPIGKPSPVIINPGAIDLYSTTEREHLSWDEEFTATASTQALRALLLLSADAQARYATAGAELAKSQFHSSAIPILTGLVHAIRSAYTPTLPHQSPEDLIKVQSRLVDLDTETGGNYDITGVLPENISDVVPPWAPAQIKALHAQKRPLEAYMYGLTAAAIRFARTELPHKDTSHARKLKYRHPIVFGFAVARSGALPPHFMSVPDLGQLGSLTDIAYGQSQRELSRMMHTGNNRIGDLVIHDLQRQGRVYSQHPPIA